MISEIAQALQTSQNYASIQNGTPPQVQQEYQAFDGKNQNASSISQNDHFDNDSLFPCALDLVLLFHDCQF
jgi:hypothetical protein